MPKYLVKANYVGDGLRGLLKEGGAARRAAAEKGITSLGGTMEAFYFAFGDTDAYVIAELPDQASMTALSLAINGSGLVKTQTITLLTAEEVDAAARKTTGYRAPGQ